jgi:hypothetical protein
MVNRKDVWQLDMVGRTSAERTGYVTQKPETLIQRILESCTRPGDICADFFGGSGTLAATAEKMGRRWISCDVGRLATINTYKRLTKENSGFSFYIEASEIRKEEKGNIKVNIRVERDPLSDKDVLRVELMGYEPYSLEQIPVDKKYLPVIRNIIDSDSLQLVGYWSVDTRYKDGINRPDKVLQKTAEGIETVYRVIGSDFGPVCIKAVDIFGNTATLIKEI